MATEVAANEDALAFLDAAGYETEDTEILTPGLFYRDGLMYMTFPINKRETVTVGRGKDKKEIEKSVLATIAVSNRGTVLPYTEEAVTRAGYRFPPTFTQDNETRWPLPLMRGYLLERGSHAGAPPPGEMFAELRKIWFDHVEYGDDIYYDLMPLFVMGTYVYRLFQAITYIHFNGTRAAGKSQNLRLLRAFGFNTKWASNMSSASLYRQVAGSPGVICIDEAESFDGERGEELRRLLNAGYIQGETAMRTEAQGDSWVVKSYEVFVPKVIASINPLEPTIQTRCIVVPMAPALRKIPEFDFTEERWAQTRDRLYRWAMANAETVASIYTEWNDRKRYTTAENIRNRAWQTSQLFIVLGEHVGGDAMVKKLITFFEGYYTQMAKSQEEADKQLLLLKCLPRVMATKASWKNGTAWALKDIHEIASEYLEEDAREYYKTKAVSRHLTALGFRDRETHKGGTLVVMTEQAVRDQFNKRHVSPFDEDKDWLEGKTDYAHAHGDAEEAGSAPERDFSWLDGLEPPDA